MDWLAEVWKYIWPNNLKDLAQEIQSITIIVAAFFAARFYYVRRKPYPKLSLTQEVSHYFLSDDKILLRVKLTFENKGEKLLRIDKGFIWIQQVFPIIATPEDIEGTIKANNDPVKDGALQVEWPIIAERELDTPLMHREIEPGETDEINIEFVVNNEKTTLIVFTFIGNPRESKIGWQKAAVYEVPEPDSDEGELVAVATSNTNNSSTKKVITPDPNDGKKGGPPPPKPPKVQQPPKTPKKP